MEKFIILCILFAISMFSRLIAISAIDELSKKYKCNKGKLKLNQQSLFNKITRLHLIRANINRRYLLTGLVVINNICILGLIAQIPWSVMYLFNAYAEPTLRRIALIKLVILDFPIYLFFILFFRRRGKNVWYRDWRF